MSIVPYIAAAETGPATRLSLWNEARSRRPAGGFGRIFLLGAILSVCAFSQTVTVSGNFAVNLYGTIDTRSDCWGFADSAIFPVTFKPPAGYHVRILTLKGDMVSWIKTLPGDPETPKESAAGTLLGFQSTAPDTSKECDYCAENTPLYIQDSVSPARPNSRAPFNYDDVGLVLLPDNILRVKMASWLNTTGKPIHIEATYTIRFEYESDSAVTTGTRPCRLPVPQSPQLRAN
jgi:hypothetical protein